MSSQPTEGRRYRIEIAGGAREFTTYNGIWGAIAEARELLRLHPEESCYTLHSAEAAIPEIPVMRVWREDR